MSNDTLTYERLRAAMLDLQHLIPPRESDLSLFGMKVFTAPEFPKVQLNYKCRTKYGDEFEMLTPKQQAETNAWLLAQFGTTCSVPENTAYVFNSMFGRGIHMNPRDVVKVSCI